MPFLGQARVVAQECPGGRLVAGRPKHVTPTGTLRVYSFRLNSEYSFGRYVDVTARLWAFCSGQCPKFKVYMSTSAPEAVIGPPKGYRDPQHAT